MKKMLALLAVTALGASLVAAEADAQKEQTPPKRPEMRREGGGPMMGRGMSEEDQKAMKEGQEKLRDLVQAYQKDKTEANLAAVKKQIEANYDQRVEVAQKNLDKMKENKAKDIDAQVKRLTEPRKGGEGGRRGGGERPAKPADK